MRTTSLTVVALGALAPSVYGHGQVHTFITSDPVATYVAADAYASANPESPIRKLNTYGPADPFTGPDITCGPGGNVPVAALAPVVAGSEVTFSWNPWESVHPGPIMTYMAACTGGCANFKGDTGDVWIKINDDGYDPNRPIPWAEENIRQYQTYSVKIPASIPSGEYLIRHEILGLHVAYQLDGAQFYPNCVQLQVTGGTGSSFPTNGIALPGAYDPNAGDILLQLYWITPTNSTYIVPGGPVILNGGPAIYGGSVTATPIPTPTPGGATTTTTTTTTTHSTTTAVPTTATTKSSSTTSASKSSTTTTTTTTTTTAIVATTTSASGAVQTAYGQCGGTGWTGPTACPSGWSCHSVSPPYYYQCLSP